MAAYGTDPRDTCLHTPPSEGSLDARGHGQLLGEGFLASQLPAFGGPVETIHLASWGGERLPLDVDRDRRHDLLAWLQGGLGGLGEAVSQRVREEPVLTVGLFRAVVTMLVGFGLGWTGEQVALMVAFIEAVTAWVARRQVTPITSPQLPEGQPVRLPDGTAATVVRA